MTLTDRDVFGTDEPPPARREVRAGGLMAILEGGQVRDLRWHGVLVLRGIAWLLRDAGWGTVPVPPGAVRVTEGEDAFEAAWEGSTGALDLAVRIVARAEGGGATLRMEAVARARTGVTTNRAGFVVLHPDLAAGAPLTVVHDDGTEERTAFPDRISPHQPVFAIRALEHAPAPGIAARVSFEGPPFEMEDQRNWGDASFKTYVRPLAWPFPYRIEAGEEDRQAVTVALSGRPEAAVAPTRAAATGVMPDLFVRVPETGPLPGPLPLPLAAGLIARIGPGLADPERLAAVARLARANGMRFAVEAVLPHRDPASEIRAMVDALAGLDPEAILVAATRDLKTRPTGLPEGEAPMAAMLDAFRAAGFAGRLGAGVAANFTEFNRNPPPRADIAAFGVCAIVHAADDASVMETTSVLPAILASAAALVPGADLWPGPLAIGAPVNPYGDGLAEGRSARTCLAGSDPRHGALFGAAHLVAVLAVVAGRCAAAAPLHLVGPLGLLDAEGEPLPLAHVHAEAARASGTRLVPLDLAPPLAGLAWAAGDGVTALVANLGPVGVDLPGSLQPTEAMILAPGRTGWVAAPDPHRIGPYRTLRLRLPG